MREIFKWWDLERLILEFWQYLDYGDWWWFDVDSIYDVNDAKQAIPSFG